MPSVFPFAAVLVARFSELTIGSRPKLVGCSI